uniref:Uncharacterized protein n=1 Tax=Rhabditophanes sp. KR3021 TaxID=114890 RepID=A0AC35TXN8_9BILA
MIFKCPKTTILLHSILCITLNGQNFTRNQLIEERKLEFKNDLQNSLIIGNTSSIVTFRPFPTNQIETEDQVMPLSQIGISGKEIQTEKVANIYSFNLKNVVFDKHIGNIDLVIKLKNPRLYQEKKICLDIYVLNDSVKNDIGKLEIKTTNATGIQEFKVALFNETLNQIARQSLNQFKIYIEVSSFDETIKEYKLIENAKLKNVVLNFHYLNCHDGASCDEIEECLKLGFIESYSCCMHKFLFDFSEEGFDSIAFPHKYLIPLCLSNNEVPNKSSCNSTHFGHISLFVRGPNDAINFKLINNILINDCGSFQNGQKHELST